MSFEVYFKASSLAAVAVGAAALCLAGGMPASIGIGFALVLLASWMLDGTRWQLPERPALAIVLLSVPLFYLDWKYQLRTGSEGDRVGVSALAHLLLFLSVIKLLQVKADRDWVFLYLIAFFEVLLAAGLSLSPLLVVALLAYLLCMVSTIVTFEIRKAGRVVKPAETRLLISPESRLLRGLSSGRHRRPAEIRRLPWVTAGLLALIGGLALPLFFVIPRYGASGFARSNRGLTGIVGFSDSVTLGDIGRLQQSDRTVMHVRVEGSTISSTGRPLKWRGVALDKFTGKGWIRSREGEIEVLYANEKNLFQLGTVDALHKLTVQTFFLEPLETDVLFAAPRAVALQGTLPFLRVDGEGGLATRARETSRISYKVFSETADADSAMLRKDNRPYPEEFGRYLLLPSSIDPRIRQLAQEIVRKAGANNRYDAARAIETYLQDPANFSYTLDLKAGGADPLSDFLFRVRAGHCEYFATSMAVMLRTLGIATRVVNGFQTGTYNDAADVYTVSQKDAHSWVEIYFPGSAGWVTFDPTPATYRHLDNIEGLAARLGKYAEAIDLLWTQYFIGYDQQEQRYLAAGLRNRLTGRDNSLAMLLDGSKKWLAAIFDGSVSNHISRHWRYASVLLAVTCVVLAVLLSWFAWRRKWLAGLFSRKSEKRPEIRSVIEFYSRMLGALGKRGFHRAQDQTPLEFAHQLGVPEAVMLTKAYNSVRFGEHRLSPAESGQIETWLRSIEGEQYINVIAD
jgi:hypothetical protein